MNREKKSPTLDDVLDYYLISSEERGADTLPEMIELYPQYERDLRELFALRKLQGLIGEPAYTDEDETILQARGISVVQNLLYEKRHKSESEEDHKFSSLRDEIERQYGRPEDFYSKTDLSEGIVWTLDDRQVVFESIPRIAIQKIAEALGNAFATIADYLGGEMQLDASYYRAEAPPEAAKCTFRDLVNMDDDLSPEQKEYWLAQPSIGSAKD